MDKRAISIVKNYIINRYADNKIDAQNVDVFIVWKCKILQNWKYLISTTLYDGMYYEVTYNGDREEWYLDAYQKIQNVKISDKYPN